MLVVFWNNGQLGNRLFYFSHFVAFAHQSKSKLLCLFFGRNASHYSSPFVGTQGNLIGKYPKSFCKTGTFSFRLCDWFLYKIFLLAKRFSFNNKLISIYTPPIEGKEDSTTYSVTDLINDKNRKKSILTFYNSHIFWHDNTDLLPFHSQLTEYFKPVEPYFTNIKNFIHSIKSEYENATIIGVHIRRGDYKDWADGMWYFDDEAFSAHLHIVQDLLFSQKTVFVICSNESINFDNYTGLTLKRSTGNMIEDMYILSECDMIIGPHSTYSMWASFYGQIPLYKMKKGVNSFTLEDFKICNGRFYEL